MLRLRLAILAGNGVLGNHLLFGGLECGRGEGHFAHLFELLCHQVQAFVYIALVTAEIDNRNAGGGIAHVRGVDMVNQRLLFAQSAVQTGVAGWAAEDVGQQRERHPVWMAERICPSAKYAICLMEFSRLVYAEQVLGRLAGHVRRGFAPGKIGGVLVQQFLDHVQHLLLLEVAHHHKAHVVRHVALAHVCADIVGSYLLERSGGAENGAG